jgi:hypothetical protein
MATPGVPPTGLFTFQIRAKYIPQILNRAGNESSLVSRLFILNYLVDNVLKEVKQFR